MILNINVDNYKGVRKDSTLSCIASNKISHSPNEFVQLTDKHKILKNICLIGSNASGKTSFLNAIETIQSFLIFPLRKQFTNEKEYTDRLESMSAEELKKFIIKFNTLKLGEQNNLREEDATKISIELYVPKREENIPGIYKYTLHYDKEYSKAGVLLERLEYKESIDCAKKTLLVEKNNIIESEIGTAILYENNSNYKKNKYIEYLKSFFEEIIEHITYLSGKGQINFYEIINNYKDEFIELTKIADDKLLNVTIDENEDIPQIRFWNSKNTFINFSQLSSGTKKVLIYGSIIIDSIRNNDLLIIDEIELSLHHALAKFLIDLSISKKNSSFSQLIFTTHSPFIAFGMANDQLYYIDNKKDNYYITNITNAIKNKIITRDQSIEKAWLDDLLIKNPDQNQIKTFIDKTNI